MPDPQNRFNFVMEASLTSGSDGFSNESGQKIFSYLNSRSVTCDASVPVPALPTPPPVSRTRQPVPAPPTPAPVRRTRQPVPAPPTPAPVRRTRRPVPAPPTPAPVRRTRRPVPAPPTPAPVRRTRQPVLAPPTPSPVNPTPQCPRENPICIVENDIPDRFACFRYSAITPAECNGIHYELAKCNKMKLRRSLNEGCHASCILLKEFVCLNGSTGNHELEFKAIDSKGRSTGDTIVKEIPVNKSKKCVVARAKCNA